ncbi:MAG: hypothetical protein RMJ85_08690, partial [Anaerolineales bacterium]|nr:hypothetical protein [Anaerolineales bacterium]
FLFIPEVYQIQKFITRSRQVRVESTARPGTGGKESGGVPETGKHGLERAKKELSGVQSQ